MNEERRLQYRYTRPAPPGDAADACGRATASPRSCATILGEQGFWEIETPFLTKSTPKAAATSSCRAD